MKKHTMRILAVLLTLAMLIGAVPAAAFAQDGTAGQAAGSGAEKADAGGALKLLVTVEVGNDATDLKDRVSSSL